LSEDPDLIDMTKAARDAASAKIKPFVVKLNGFGKILTSSGLTDAPAAGEPAKQGGAKLLNILTRTANSLPQLFGLLTQANDRTLKLLAEESFEDANSNFVYEESERVVAINSALGRIETNLQTLSSNLEAKLDGDRQHEADMASAALGELLEQTYVLIGAIAILVAFLAAWFAVFRLAKPLNSIASTMKILSTCDMSVEIPTTGNDEIGAMAEAVKVFKQNMGENERLQAEGR
jgi:HAMP domain-containing protein